MYKIVKESIIFIILIIFFIIILIYDTGKIDNLKVYGENSYNTQETIVDLENKVEHLESELKEKKEKLRQIENQELTTKDLKQNLMEEKLYYSMISGSCDVTGPGIRILMYDNPDKRDLTTQYDLNLDVIHDTDLINILNDLKVAGAEALSVNGNRITSKSEIICGGPIVRINGQPVAMPFIIEAIGDVDSLKKAVSDNNTNGFIIKNVFNKGFIVKEYDKMVIESYDNNQDEGYLYFTEELNNINLY